MSPIGRPKAGRYSLALLFLLSMAVILTPAASAGSLAQQANTPVVSARAAILVDYQSGHVIFAKSEHDRMAMASTTKLMTALLAAESGKLETVVTIEAEDLVPGTTMGLQAGEQQTLRNLLYGLLLPSGNDAAMAIARFIGTRVPGAGSPVERFVGLMNAKAQKMGLKDTHFANPHGLDAPGHYTSAYDLASIMWYDLHFPALSEIMKQQNYDAPGHQLKNLNKMLAKYPGADGGKTGFTDDAGLCLVATAARNGHRLISVVLDAPKWIDDSTAMLDSGFASFGPTATPTAPLSPSATATWVPTATATPDAPAPSGGGSVATFRIAMPPSAGHSRGPYGPQDGAEVVPVSKVLTKEARAI